MTSPENSRLDWGKTAADYAVHRHGFPKTFYARLAALDVIRPGLQVVDLGTGTGTVARELAQRGCNVIGIDLSDAMLEHARHLAREANLPAQFTQARAEATGLRSSCCDLVSAGTCWHWFNRPAAAQEARRLLRPHGAIMVAAMDIADTPGSIGAALAALFQEFYGLSREALLKARDRMTFNWPAWLDDLTAAGFSGFECFGFEPALEYTQEAFRGRIRASAAGGVAVPPARRAEFERSFEAMLQLFPSEPLIVFHRVFAVIGHC
jgi:SAM-dependent methyltransferase